MQPIYGLTAFGFLIFYLFAGKMPIVLGIAAVIGAKIVLDLAFHLWSIRVYRRWLEPSVSLSPWLAVLASLIEPFTVQLLRHAAAIWGWMNFV